MFERICAAWRAFWNSTAPVAVVTMEPEPRKVSTFAMWEFDRGNTPYIMPQRVFERPQPMKGVLPAGMAMDSLPDMNQFAAPSYASMLSEGLGFLGYAYLAELSQRAEYRKIVSIWAEHCTRKWIKITGSNEEKIALIEAEFKRLDLQSVFREAIEKEGFFGRCQLFLDFGDYDNDPELQTRLVIDPAKISPKRPLKRVGVVEPMWSYPGPYEAVNPLAPDFYKPHEWYVSGKIVHASRLLTLVGHEMPNMLKPAYAFGGVSLTQMCKPYVDNWLRARQSGSDMVNAYSTMVLATDMEQLMTGGQVGNGLINRVAAFNKFRTNQGTFVVDKNTEDFKNVSVPISGLDKLIAQAQEQMSSVSSIPLVVLLGITPTGLNASSEGEFRVFYDAILAYNQKVARRPLHTIMEIVQLSLFGEIDDEISFEFVPLWEMTDKDKADIRKSDADADAVYIQAGVISPEESRDRLNNEEGGAYHGQLSGAAPEVDDDGELDAEAALDSLVEGSSREAVHQHQLD